MSTRNAYPSDVSEDEWSFVAPYLTLMTEDAPQRDHPLRGVFNGLRWLVRTGSPWRYLPNDLPPWYTVYQQTHRWIAAGCFGGIVHNLRELLRVAGGRKAQPSAVVLDGRTLQSSIESGAIKHRERLPRRLRWLQGQAGQHPLAHRNQRPRERRCRP